MIIYLCPIITTHNLEFSLGHLAINGINISNVSMRNNMSLFAAPEVRYHVCSAIYGMKFAVPRNFVADRYFNPGQVIFIGDCIVGT